MLTEREITILNHVKTKTKVFIESMNINNLESDAKTIGLDLDIERSNVSRILNNLYREGFLIKITGRPTFFLDREVIKESFPDTFFPSIIKSDKDLLKLVDVKESRDRKAHLLKENDYMIGTKPNESLFKVHERLKIIASYPNHQYNLLLTGSMNSGKDTVAKNLHAIGTATGNYSQKMGIIDFQMHVDNLEEFSQRIHKHLTKNIEENKINLVLLKNIDQIPDKFSYDIYKQLSILQSRESPIKRQFIATSLQNDHPSVMNLFFDEIIQIPDFDTKTIKEKVEFIFDTFQLEANQTHMSICISKNVLSCFVMAKYPYNLKSLESEIKFAVSNSYFRHIFSSSNMIDIDLDDLSDNLLNSIVNVTNRLEKLEQIFDLIGDSDIYFIPETSPREREMLKQINLDHQENIVDGVENLQKLSTVCKKDIDEYSKKKINTIKSIYIKNIYDILYPIITNFNAHIPDNIIYGLFIHLENTIKSIQDKNYRQPYYSDIDEVDSKVIKVENQISKIIKENFDVVIPTVEKQYIRAYLEYAQTYGQQGNIGIILVSHSLELEDAYKNYINKTYQSIKINTLNTFENFRFSNQKAFFRAIIETIKKSNQGKGVVILTDVQSLVDYQDEIEKELDIPFVVLSPISLPLVTQVSSLVNRKEVKLKELSLLNNFHYQNNLDREISSYITHPNEMIHEFSNKILSETLIFLNPNKAVNVLSHALMNIYNDLNIPHDDSITIRFIHHCSFMIERVIRDEPLNYKDTKDIIFKNNDIYQTIEKNFQVINNNFGINIPASEIALVANIFIENGKIHE